MKLKHHLLPRILCDFDDTGHGTSDALDKIFFHNDRLYEHHICRINYTTYDVRRAQDVVNARTSHCNVMVLASQGPHRFHFARVLGIYHANVIYTGAIAGRCNYQPTRLEFLWVRWYKQGSVAYSWEDCLLDRLSFPPLDDINSFGFIDPLNVLRSCHVLPRFSQGKREDDDMYNSSLISSGTNYMEYYLNR